MPRSKKHPTVKETPPTAVMPSELPPERRAELESIEHEDVGTRRISTGIRVVTARPEVIELRRKAAAEAHLPIGPIPGPGTIGRRPSKPSPPSPGGPPRAPGNPPRPS